ncbi:MAG: hypothetical protein WD767_00290 [Alphaproteobacteria bacterium]
MTGLLLLVFLAALLARVINIALLPISVEYLTVEDAILYWDGAKVLLDHGVFGRLTDTGIMPETERAPGYIFFLAGLRWLFSDSLVGILLAQAVLDSLTCVLIAVTGAQLSRSLALAGGLLAACWVNLIIHSGMILSDSLFVFLMTAMLAAAAQFLRTASLGSVALAGLSLGLALATRSVAQLLPFLMLPAAFGVPLFHRRGAAVAALSAVLFLVLSLLPVSPLIYRNLTEFDTLAISSQTGTHLAGWVVPLVRRAADGTPRGQGAAELGASIERRIETEGLLEADATPFQRSALFQEHALRALWEYPPGAVAKAWLNGALINLTAPAIAVDPRIRQLPHASFDSTAGDGIVAQARNMLAGSSAAYIAAMAGGLVFAALFSVAQLYGLVCLFRIAPWAAIFATLCAGYFLAINGPVGSPKYRLPFEPVLILLSGLAFLDIARRFRRR